MKVSGDIFKKINNAVLDLQASELQTYEQPLKTLVRLLRDPCFEDVNATLTKDVDFDSFLTASEETQGGMVGTSRLLWPEDEEKVLGLKLILLDKLASDSSFVFNFSHQFFYSDSKIMSGIHSLTRQLVIPFVRDYKEYVMTHGPVQRNAVSKNANTIFIVHGHDGEARESVARFITNIGFIPIILHEQANRGRTVIEKVEAHGDVGFAVVLLTPDDEGRAVKGEYELEPRARQNVLLELGYFIGRLGRENVCAFKRGVVEVPSDFAGVIWETMDAGNGWKQCLGRELEAAGYHIDWNLVMRS